MVCLNPDVDLSNEYSEYDDRCRKKLMDNCSNCEQTLCTNHNLKRYQERLQKKIQHALRRQESLIQKLKSSITQLSVDALFDKIEGIFEFKMKSNEIQETVNQIQHQLITKKDDSKVDQYDILKNSIRNLKKDVKQLELILEEVIDNVENRVSQEQTSILHKSVQSSNSIKSIESPLFIIVSSHEKPSLPADDNVLGNNIKQQMDCPPMLSHLRLRQMSPAIIDLKDKQLDSTAMKGHAEVAFISSDTVAKINHKVHLSNNIVSLMQGPAKVMVDSSLHAMEAFATAKHASDYIITAVNNGLLRQKQTAMEEQMHNTANKPVFAEITSDWIFEEENIDKGFSSASIWMRDSQGERVLVKTQDLPLCAANERLAYTLGRQMGLPVNRVQIAIYQKELVTIHTDVNQGNEKTITLMELPRRIRKILMTDPIMGAMDIFDNVIQNVDRNPRNILITAPEATDIEDDAAKLRIHLIDHDACFGMGKLNGLSVMASKLRTHHVSVVKFDPIKQAKKFDRFLSKLSAEDRILMEKTLNRLAAITDDQIASWLSEVHDLLTSSQYRRIYSVLYRQRDVARRYTMQWGIYSGILNTETKETDEHTSQISDLEAYF